MVRTSMSSGTFWRMNSPSVSNEAARIGSAAFFAPETRTRPARRVPPRSRSLSMTVPGRGEGALVAAEVAEDGDLGEARLTRQVGDGVALVVPDLAEESTARV